MHQQNGQIVEIGGIRGERSPLWRCLSMQYLRIPIWYGDVTYPHCDIARDTRCQVDIPCPSRSQSGFLIYSKKSMDLRDNLRSHNCQTKYSASIQLHWFGFKAAYDKEGSHFRLVCTLRRRMRCRAIHTQLEDPSPPSMIPFLVTGSSPFPSP